MNKNILIIDGYARQTLPMSKAFKKLGCRVTVLCYSKLDVGYASKYPDKKILLKCSKTEHDKQLEFITKLLQKEKYDLVVPMTDYSAIYLSKNKKELSRYTSIAVNDPEIFDLAIDKLKTMKICQENGINAPITLFSTNIIEDIDNSNLQYPIIIKPRTASGSIGFNIVESKEKLESILKNYDFTNGPLFVQEYIPQKGAQFGSEVFRDKNGNINSLLINEKPRWFPIDGGSPTINTTIFNKEIEKLSIKLLNAMNYIGYANIDFILDARDNKFKIIEVNARISAAVKINFYAGIDIAKLIIENEFNNKVSFYNNYKKKISVRCILTELIWFIKSKNRFNTKPSIFNLKNQVYSIFSWKDPYPFVVFSIQSMLNYKKEMKKRKRK